MLHPFEPTCAPARQNMSSTSEPDTTRTLPPPPHRPVSALQCYLTYLVSISIGAACWFLLYVAMPENSAFLNGLIVTTVSTLVIWLFSMANGNSSLYDPYWVIAPPLLVLGIVADSNGGLVNWHWRQFMIFACFVMWAGRYHVVLFWDGWTKGLSIEDWRYENMRSAPIPYWLNSLVGMHHFPTYLVYFAFAPAALVLMQTPPEQPELTLWDMVGAVGALAATLIQYVADTQNKAFQQSPAYRNGGSIRSGLWAWSRHPNYFGEVLFWLSLIPFALAAGIFESHMALVLSGPVVMAIFFRFSAHLMDKRSLERRCDYDGIMKDISPLLPWIPGRPS